MNENISTLKYFLLYYKKNLIRKKIQMHGKEYKRCIKIYEK
jgi:hypothetical protein